jgi:type II secretory pathway pseudopilin PulG
VSVRRHLQDLARDERGVGLIELIVVLAILGTIVGVIVMLFVSAMRSEVDLSERVNAQEEARLALETLRREVHEACAIAPTGVSSTVTLTMPGDSTTGAEPDLCASGTTEVTWCTRGSGQRRTLHRVVGNGAACASLLPPPRWADYLTAPNVFDHVPATPSSLAYLRVDLPVDLKPTDTNRAYRLRDSLALRNSQRQ